MKASLKFERYYVLETYYYNNPFVDEDVERSISPRIQWNIKHHNDELSDAGVFLKITLGDKEEGFYLTAHIFGEFSINEKEEMSLEEKEKMYRINAISILFPYLRALVSDMTSKGDGADHLILPPLNVHKLLSDEKS